MEQQWVGLEPNSARKWVCQTNAASQCGHQGTSTASYSHWEANNADKVYNQWSHSTTNNPGNTCTPSVSCLQFRCSAGKCHGSLTLATTSAAILQSVVICTADDLCCKLLQVHITNGQCVQWTNASTCASAECVQGTNASPGASGQ